MAATTDFAWLEEWVVEDDVDVVDRSWCSNMYDSVKIPRMPSLGCESRWSRCSNWTVPEKVATTWNFLLPHRFA